MLRNVLLYSTFTAQTETAYSVHSRVLFYIISGNHKSERIDIEIHYWSWRAAIARRTRFSRKNTRSVFVLLHACWKMNRISILKSACDIFFLYKV